LARSDLADTFGELQTMSWMLDLKSRRLRQQFDDEFNAEVVR
jgi:hypothetical protein